MTTLRMHDDDDVLILIEPITVPGAEGKSHRLAPGHKVARRAIKTGDPIRKYGQIIGYASADIAEGAHVHSHNCVFGDHAGDVAIGGRLDAARAAIPSSAPRQFQGYRRSDGSVGTRNYIALIATVNCSATVIRQAAQALEASGALQAFPGIDGVVALAHGSGCGMAATGEGADILERVLWGYATHPNVGLAVFVGLGCEVMQVARMRAKFGKTGSERLQGLTIQDSGGTQATIAQIVREVTALLPVVGAAQRTACDASDLTVGLQCGGSDGLSGITANPALGAASDLLVSLGGRVILSETPEIYGAENLLLSRAATPQVGASLQKRIAWWEAYTDRHGASLDNNPSPGNKAGGLTTILEKSLGAVSKAGATPLNEVVEYGVKPKASGLIFMDTPGYDPVSVTGQIAGGAQVIVFTTGRGSAFGSKPAPTVKLATNDALYRKMTDDMDLNCGDILTAGVPLQTKGQDILDLVLAAASGQLTKSERLGLGDSEFVPWQIGAVL